MSLSYVSTELLVAEDRSTPPFSCCRAQYAPALERDPFPSGGGPRSGNTADYVWMTVIGMLVTLGFGFALGRAFLGTALLSAVVYVWAKRHPEAQTSFYGFGFKAAYLPFVLLGEATRDLG